MSGEDGKVVRYEVSCAQFGCGSEHNEWDWKRVGEREKKKKKKKENERKISAFPWIYAAVYSLCLWTSTQESLYLNITAHCGVIGWDFFQAATSNNSGRCLGKKISRDSNALGSMFVVAVVQYGGVYQVCVKEKATKIKCAYCGGTKTIVFTVSQCSPKYNELLGLR